MRSHLGTCTGSPHPCPAETLASPSSHRHSASVDPSITVQPRSSFDGRIARISKRQQLVLILQKNETCQLLNERPIENSADISSGRVLPDSRRCFRPAPDKRPERIPGLPWGRKIALEELVLRLLQIRGSDCRCGS